MIKTKILELLKKHITDLRKFHVASLAVFGSVARGEERPDSDIDILVKFDGPTKFDWYMDLKEFLETLLSRKIDLVTEAGLKPIVKAPIEKDLIRVT
jgi:predicted nucleotidyltransferase